MTDRYKPPRRPIQSMFVALWEAMDNYGEKPFSNATFEVSPYWWGDCTCNNFDGDEDACEPDCLMVRPNFIYKPTDLRGWWYKYPWRSPELSREVSSRELAQIVTDCLTSLEWYGGPDDR